MHRCSHTVKNDEFVASFRALSLDSLIHAKQLDKTLGKRARGEPDRLVELPLSHIK